MCVMHKEKCRAATSQHNTRAPDMAVICCSEHLCCVFVVSCMPAAGTARQQNRTVPGPNPGRPSRRPILPGEGALSIPIPAPGECGEGEWSSLETVLVVSTMHHARTSVMKYA